MVTRADPARIGLFVVVAVVLVVAGVIVFGSGAFFRREFKMVAYFDSSVAGLDVGAPIRFKGVRLGNVSRIHAVWNAADETIKVPVELTFVEGAVRAPNDAGAQRWDDPATFMEHMITERGLRAELQQDSFVTGKLFVALEIRPDAPLHREGTSYLPEMPTNEAALEKLKKSIQELPVEELMDRALTAIAAVEDFVTNPAISEALDNVNQLAVDLDESLVPLTRSADETLTEVRRLARDTDAKLVRLADDLHAFLGDARAQIEPLGASSRETLAQAREALARFDAMLASDDSLVYRTASMLEELEDAARSIRVLAEYLERHPEALLSGKDTR